MKTSYLNGILSILINATGIIFTASLLFGCTGYNLSMQEEGSVKASGVSESTLPPPISLKAPLRVVFMVDQSHSMAFKKCDTDLDGANPDPTGPACTPDLGVDPDRDRYSVLKKWIESLQQTSSDEADADRVKIAIFPFSGGVTARPMNGENTDKFKFLSPEDALARVAELDQEQQDQAKNPFGGIKSQKMGTTVPEPHILRAETLIKGEMVDLESKDLLDVAKFEFVFLSDGVMKPIQSLYEKFMKAANCPTDCSNQRSKSLACNSRFSTNGDLGKWPLGTPFQYCQQTLPQAFKITYGDPLENTVEKVSQALQSIVQLPDQFQAGSSKVRLVQIYPDRIPAEDQVSPEVNLFDELKESLSVRNPVEKYILNSNQVPFSLHMRRSTQLSFKIHSLLIYNANAFVNPSGELVVDSDGDGLSDKNEIELGYNPKKSRTNDACLDGIDYRFGCDRKTSCDIKKDMDGDGLNECEELTIGSSPFNADSDGDGILDFFEAVRGGLNVNKDDSSISKAGDGYTDHQHFFRGVHSQVAMSSVSPDSILDFRIQEMAQLLSDGNRFSKYIVDITNVPLVATKQREAAISMGRYIQDQFKQHPFNLSFNLDVQTQENMNTLIFLAKVISQENPENFYWLILKKNYKSIGINGDVSISIDLSNMQELTTLRFE